MTVHAFPARAASRQSRFIELKREYFKVNYDQNAVMFTPEGAAYYRLWFSRFGFQLDAADARAFFEAVQFINREASGLKPEALERKLRDPALGEAERALWEHFLAGDMDEFSARLTAVADNAAVQGTQAANVVSIR
jgi:hypothetical protein